MVNLLVVVLLLALAALVAGLIKPSLLRQSSRNRVGFIFGGTTLIVFILLAIVSPTVPKTATVAIKESPPSEQNADNPVGTTPGPAQSAPVAPTQTDQQKLESNLGGVVAAFTGTTKVNYGSIEIQSEASDPARPKGAQMLVIGVNVSDFYSRNAFISDTGKLSAKLFQASYPSYLAPYDVVVQYHGQTTDRYGNKSDSVISTYSIDKTTYAKINWSNFDSTGLCDFLKSEMAIDDDGPVCTIIPGLQ